MAFNENNNIRNLLQAMIDKREGALEMKDEEVRNSNMALSDLLKRRANEKQIREEQSISNVNVIILSQNEKLRKNLNGKNALLHVNPVERTLSEFLPMLIDCSSVNYSNLTDKETQIAKLSYEGKITKDIMDILNISESAVNMHRYNIRNKLNPAKQQAFKHIPE